MTGEEDEEGLPRATPVRYTPVGTVARTVELAEVAVGGTTEEATAAVTSTTGATEPSTAAQINEPSEARAGGLMSAGEYAERSRQDPCPGGVS